MGASRTYTRAEQDRIIAAVRRGLEAGKRVAISAVELGITEGTFYRWLRERARGQVCTSGSRDAEERSRIIAAVQRRMELGERVAEAARAEGVSGATYYNWLHEGGPAAVTLRPVALVPAPVTMEVTTAAANASPVPAIATTPPTVGTLALVAPGGYRIEGLGVESAAALLKALA